MTREADLVEGIEMSLIDEICGVLRLETPERVADELFLAGQLFERWRQQTYGGNPYAHHAEEVVAEPLSEVGIERLRHAMAQFIRSHLEDDMISTAVFALGKLANPGDEKLFAEVLRFGLAQSHSEALYQALIALDNLGQLGDWSGCLSPLDDTVNRELAARYLRRIGTKGDR